MRLFAALAIGLALAACGPAVQVEDRVENFAADDTAMNAAIAEARTGLPRFWELFDAGEGSDFSLKVGFPTDDGSREHIWVDEIRRDGDAITARVANEPQNVSSLQMGARTAIDEDLISDWTLAKDSRTYGHRTTRVIINSLPAEEQAPYADFLSMLADGQP